MPLGSQNRCEDTQVLYTNVNHMGQSKLLSCNNDGIIKKVLLAETASHWSLRRHWHLFEHRWKQGKSTNECDRRSTTDIVKVPGAQMLLEGLPAILGTMGLN